MKKFAKALPDAFFIMSIGEGYSLSSYSPQAPGGVRVTSYGAEWTVADLVVMPYLEGAPCTAAIGVFSNL